MRKMPDKKNHQQLPFPTWSLCYFLSEAVFLRGTSSMTCISICPDQSLIGQVTTPVVIALKSNSARLMTCPQFGQTCTLSQESASFGSVPPALISPFHSGRFSVEPLPARWFRSPIGRYSALSRAGLENPSNFPCQ
jgi:hypothetical protein